jgi:hypothetical protein
VTFIIPENTPVPVRRGPDIAPSTNTAAMGAAARSYWQSINVWGQRQRQVIGEKGGIAETAIPRLGPDGMKPIIEDFNRKTMELGLPERAIPENATPAEIMGKLGPNGQDTVLEAARAAAAADPTAWADIDLSDEGVEARVTERRKAEAQADAELVAMSPNPVFSSIVGSLGAGIADPINLALAPLGLGGGSILRIMGREALLGMTAEAIQYPTRAKVADELGQQAPDLMESLAMGAAGGAILGGAIEGVPRAIRALRYYGTLKAGKAPPGVSPATHEAAVQKAEEALASGDDPLQAVRDVLAAEPMPKREPLILTPDMSVTARTPEPTPLAPDPITTQSLPPVEGIAPTTPGETAAMAEKALNRVAPREKNPTDLSTFVVRSGGIWKGDDRGELAAMDYRRPGFLKKEKLARSNAGNNGGGRTIDEMREAAAQAGYLPMESTINDFLDLLSNERSGLKAYPLGEAAPLRQKTYSPDYKPEETYLDMNPDQAEFFVDLDMRQGFDADWEGTLEKDFSNYLADRKVTLLPRESAEILSVLKQRGGDAADLVDRALERELDETEYALLRKMRGEPDARTDAFPFGPEDDLAQATGGAGRAIAGRPDDPSIAAAEPGAGGGELPGFERTDAGVQSVIPGSRINDSAARRAEQAKAEAAAKAIQSKMRKNGQIRVEDDVNGLFAVKQLDIFDDINSPEAQAFMDANVQGMRDILEAEGDIAMDAAVMADDGSALNSLSSILREIDDMDTLASEFAKCRTGGAE